MLLFKYIILLKEEDRKPLQSLGLLTYRIYMHVCMYVSIYVCVDTVNYEDYKIYELRNNTTPYYPY